MVKVGFSVLNVPRTVSAGAALDAASMERKTVSLESVGTATYQVQISCDLSESPASASWQNEGAALTASGTLEITKPCAWIRVNCTAFTSGNPVGRVAGLVVL